jgi:hypothetical protein
LYASNIGWRILCFEVATGIEVLELGVVDAPENGSRNSLSTRYSRSLVGWIDQIGMNEIEKMISRYSEAVFACVRSTVRAEDEGSHAN